MRGIPVHTHKDLLDLNPRAEEEVVTTQNHQARRLRSQHLTPYLLGDASLMVAQQIVTVPEPKSAEGSSTKRMPTQEPSGSVPGDASLSVLT